MTYIGIDPGKKGSLALLENGKVSIFPFDEDTYINVLGKVCCHVRLRQAERDSGLEENRWQLNWNSGSVSSGL